MLYKRRELLEVVMNVCCSLIIRYFLTIFFMLIGIIKMRGPQKYWPLWKLFAIYNVWSSLKTQNVHVHPPLLQNGRKFGERVLRCRDPPPSPSLISTFTLCVWTVDKPHGRRPQWRLTTCTANATHSLVQLVSKTKSNPSTLA